MKSRALGTGITFREQVLLILHRTPGLTPRILAQRVGGSINDMRRLLKRMEAEGELVQGPCDESLDQDRRSVGYHPHENQRRPH